MQVSKVNGITLTLSENDAKKLRRVCGFNKTVSGKIASNSDEASGAAVDAFLYQLGSALREKGIERF